MLQQQIPPPQPAARPPARIGVGIDTSRYGHYAAFLRDDQQPATDELAFAESAAGYAMLRQRLEALARRHGPVTFIVRLDAAGPYADNLLHFLQHLGPRPDPPPFPSPLAPPGPSPHTPLPSPHPLGPRPDCPPGAIPGADFVLSCGDPQRNKNYRAALFGGKKSDPVEARAAAHFAV